MTMAEVVYQMMLVKDIALNGVIEIILPVWMDEKDNIFPDEENHLLMVRL